MTRSYRDWICWPAPFLGTQRITGLSTFVSCALLLRSYGKKHRVRIVDCDIAGAGSWAYRLLIEKLVRTLLKDPRVLPFEIETDAAHDWNCEACGQPCQSI